MPESAHSGAAHQRRSARLRAGIGLLLDSAAAGTNRWPSSSATSISHRAPQSSMSCIGIWPTTGRGDLQIPKYPKLTGRLELVLGRRMSREVVEHGADSQRVMVVPGLGNAGSCDGRS